MSDTTTAGVRRDDEQAVPGPEPFDRAWLMRRLKLLERWAEARGRGEA